MERRPWYLLKLHLTLTRNLLVQNELAPSLPRLCAPNLIVLPREERISVYEKIWLKDLPLCDFLIICIMLSVSYALPFQGRTDSFLPSHHHSSEISGEIQLLCEQLGNCHMSSLLLQVLQEQTRFRL